MIKLYDTSLNLLAILNNAFNISYSQKLNEIHTASFSMPFDDLKVADCVAYNYIEIFDKNERIDMFRIMPTKLNKNYGGSIINFECEHVLATLLDDLIFKYLLIESTDNTTTALNTLLGYQTVENWELNVCDFAQNYQYKFENTNILSAIYTIPKMFSTSYYFTWDTSVYPWQLNLKTLPVTSTSRIIYRKNLIGIEKEIDPTNLCTRIYGLGSGEGINQLDIKSINSGLPYLDSSAIGTYGTICRLFIDKEIETAAELKVKMAAVLAQNENPTYTYSVNAADLYKITSDTLDKFVLGAKVDVFDTETNISISSNIVSITKTNIIDNPGDISIEISSKVENINTSIGNLQAKAILNETVSQGSSCIDSLSIQENCDKDLTGILKFFLNTDVVYVNKCLLNYEIGKFRAYEKSIASGGSSTESSTATGSSNNSSQGYEDPETIWTGTTPYHYHYLANHYHDVDIPAHTHGIDYGIYEFNYLPPSITLKVDGNVVSGVTGLSGTDINILPYLDLDVDNKVSRSTFHTIEIIPGTNGNNPDGLCRITANISWKQFIRNHEGSNL